MILVESACPHQAAAYETKVPDQSRAESTGDRSTSIDQERNTDEANGLDVPKHLAGLFPLELGRSHSSLIGSKSLNRLEPVVGSQESGVGDC